MIAKTQQFKTEEQEGPDTRLDLEYVNDAFIKASEFGLKVLLQIQKECLVVYSKDGSTTFFQNAKICSSILDEIFSYKLD